MDSGPIAHRYAKALLKLVRRTGAGEKVYAQAGVLVYRMRTLRRLADVVQGHPEVSPERKADILEAALGEQLAPELRRFVGLVCDRGRIWSLERMLYSFLDQYRSAESIKVGRLVTACPVPGLKEKLQTVLSERTGAAVTLDENVDPSIIGGFILSIDDLRMDACVAGQLRRLHRELVDDNNRIV